MAKKKTVIKGPKILRVLNQIGKSKIRDDLIYEAAKPGKRVSKTGRIYYERRANRSDKVPKNKL